MGAPLLNICVSYSGPDRCPECGGIGEWGLKLLQADELPGAAPEAELEDLPADLRIREFPAPQPAQGALL